MKDTSLETEKTFTPRTPLGRKLLPIRIRAIEMGMRLLSADGVIRKVKQLRGGIKENGNH